MSGARGKRGGRRIEPRFDESASDRDLRADPADRPPGAQKAREEAPPPALLPGRARLLVFRARNLGRRRARRPVRLLREPAAADRPARGAQAPARHPDPRRRRQRARRPRRHRRRGCPPGRPAALSAQGLRRHRGPALLLSLRRRSDRHLPRRRQRHRRLRRHAGRLDADPAARQEPVPDPGAHDQPQDPGGDPGALAGAQIFQGPDPRTLSQPRLFRLRRLWRGGGGAQIFRQATPRTSRSRRPRCWRA